MESDLGRAPTSIEGVKHFAYAKDTSPAVTGPTETCSDKQEPVGHPVECLGLTKRWSLYVAS